MPETALPTQRLNQSNDFQLSLAATWPVKIAINKEMWLYKFPNETEYSKQHLRALHWISGEPVWNRVLVNNWRYLGLCVHGVYVCLACHWWYSIACHWWYSRNHQYDCMWLRGLNEWQCQIHMWVNECLGEKSPSLRSYFGNNFNGSS